MVCAVALVTPVSTAETAEAKVIWFEVSLEPVEPLLDGGSRLVPPGKYYSIILVLGGDATFCQITVLLNVVSNDLEWISYFVMCIAVLLSYY